MQEPGPVPIPPPEVGPARPSEPTTQPAGTPAAGGALSEHPALHTARRIWAAAYRDAADHANAHSVPAIRSFAHFLADRADAIGRGDFTPWADTPEPSTPPAQQPHAGPAAAGPPPGTLDGPGVLGRALLDEDGGLWPLVGEEDAHRCGAVTPSIRDRFEADRGQCREVLLVDPARQQSAGLVLDAVRELAGCRYGKIRDRQRAMGQLLDAVDAYDRPTTGGDFYEDDEPAEEVAAAFERAEKGTTRRPGTRVEASGVTLVDQSTATSQPAPELAGDGPGWTRGDIEAFLANLGAAPHDGVWNPEMADEIRALLADRDRWAKVSGKWADETIAARSERDAARAELANAARSARDSAAYVEQAWAEVERLRAELATARRDAAADALDWAAGHPAYGNDGIGRGLLNRWAAEVRSGARPVPGSPQPAPDGGEESNHA